MVRLPSLPPTQLQVGGTLLQEHHAERPGVSDTARLCGYVSPLPLHSLHTALTLSSHDTRNAPRGPIGGIVISAGLMGGINMNLMKRRKRVMFLLNSIKPVFVFTARRYEAPLSLQVPERIESGLSDVGEAAVSMP